MAVVEVTVLENSEYMNTDLCDHQAHLEATEREREREGGREGGREMDDGCARDVAKG